MDKIVRYKFSAVDKPARFQIGVKAKSNTFSNMEDYAADVRNFPTFSDGAGLQSNRAEFHAGWWKDRTITLARAGRIVGLQRGCRHQNERRCMFGNTRRFVQAGFALTRSRGLAYTFPAELSIKGISEL